MFKQKKTTKTNSVTQSSVVYIDSCNLDDNIEGVPCFSWFPEAFKRVQLRKTATETSRQSASMRAVIFNLGEAFMSGCSSKNIRK